MKVLHSHYAYTLFFYLSLRNSWWDQFSISSLTHPDWWRPVLACWTGDVQIVWGWFRSASLAPTPFSTGLALFAEESVESQQGWGKLGLIFWHSGSNSYKACKYKHLWHNKGFFSGGCYISMTLLTTSKALLNTLYSYSFFLMHKATSKAGFITNGITGNPHTNVSPLANGHPIPC